MVQSKKKSKLRDESRRAPVGSIGWRMRELRLDKTPIITLKDLATAAKVSIQSVSELERGESKSPKPENLFKFAERLNVNPYYLATGKGPKDPITSITPQESELLLMFREMDEVARADLIGYARGLTRKKAPFVLVATPRAKAE